MAICWKREWKSQPIMNILGSFPPSLWSITVAKSTRSRGADDVIQSINEVIAEVRNGTSFTRGTAAV
jgi:hypothetical protein